MTVTSEIDNLIDRIVADLKNLRRLAAAEYSRGEQDAIARIVSAAKGPQLQPQIPAQKRLSLTLPKKTNPAKKERAPMGAPRALVDRILSEKNGTGASPLEIKTAAKTPDEKLVSYSAIRVQLDLGKEEGRYESRAGKWHKV